MVKTSCGRHVVLGTVTCGGADSCHCAVSSAFQIDIQVPKWQPTGCRSVVTTSSAMFVTATETLSWRRTAYCGVIVEHLNDQVPAQLFVTLALMLWASVHSIYCTN